MANQVRGRMAQLEQQQLQLVAQQESGQETVRETDEFITVLVEIDGEDVEYQFPPDMSDEQMGILIQADIQGISDRSFDDIVANAEESQKEILFAEAVEDLLVIEGGFSDDPDDRGGRTRFGISSKWHPDVNLDELTREGAAKIYREEYWNPNRYDELPKNIGRKVFNAATNIGPSRANKMLQKAMGLKSEDQDGKIGDDTIKTAHNKDSDIVVARIIKSQQKLYDTIIKKTPSQEKWTNGWRKRANYSPNIPEESE